MSTLNKIFRIQGDQIERLIPAMGGCFASDRITVDGLRVGYMYRENGSDEFDSGWRFMAGDESHDYIDQPDHLGVYDVNTICNYDREIIPFLSAPPMSAFERCEGMDGFVEVPFTGDEESER